MELGLNPTIDDISAAGLDKLRKELFGVIPNSTLEAVMIRAADAMHNACATAYNAGHYDGEAAALGAVPDNTL